MFPQNLRTRWSSLLQNIKIGSIKVKTFSQQEQQVTQNSLSTFL